MRKWVVLGALAAVSWLVPGCTNTNRDTASEAQTETGTGGAGGAGQVPQETGTQGQGVTGGSNEDEMNTTRTESGGIRSPNVPEPQSDEERFKKK
jgi:hypothetical protein